MRLNLQYFAEQTQQNPPEGIQKDPSEGTPPTVEDKKFTQDEVNRIIGERLAKEKAKAETELIKREQELAQREFQFKAKEILIGKDLPESLMLALKCDDIDTFLKSVEIVEQAYYSKDAQRKAVPRFVGPVTNSPTLESNTVRKAMGLFR